MAGRKSHAIARAGMQLVHEERRIFGALNVEENLVLAGLTAEKRWPLARIYEMQAVAVGFDVVFPEPDRASPREAVKHFRNIDQGTRELLAHLPSNDDVFAQTIGEGKVVLGQSGTHTGNTRASGQHPETGIATIFTAVTLSVGVATWSFSELKFQADMGILLTFMFMINMLMAMTLLPALAVMLDVLIPRRRPVRTPLLSH